MSPCERYLVIGDFKLNVVIVHNQAKTMTQSYLMGGVLVQRNAVTWCQKRHISFNY